ncbi:ligand-binding sensor domain-containing protein [Chitinophagaceae bacterium MMS25-I14]
MIHFGEIQNYVRCRGLLLIACCVLLSSAVIAQRVPFYNLGIENGLIQSQPMCLTQDSAGHLWIGTLGGLSRYDGSTFTNYSVRDGLPENTVRSIATDNKGRLWIGTTKGLCIFNGRRFTHISLPTDSGINEITKIQTTPSGNTWCLSGRHLCLISGSKSRIVTLPDSNAFPISIMADNDRLLVGTSEGKLLCYRYSKWDSLAFPARTDNARVGVFNFYKDRQQQIWLLTNKGPYKLIHDSVVIPRFGNRLFENLPPSSCMTEDRNGDYWMGTASGIVRISDSSLIYYNKKNGLSNNSFTDVLTDKEGNVWLACDGQGLFRFSGTLFTGLDESVGLPSAQIMGIAATRNGMLYLGTYDAGLYLYQNGQTGAVAFPQMLKPTIGAMAVRKGYELWIGTRGFGLWRYDFRGFKSYIAPAHNILSNSITSLYCDTSGRLWVGFENGAAVLYKDTFRRVQVHGVSIEAFIQIGADSILMATTEGMKLYDNGAVKPFVTKAAPDSATAQCFTLRGKELWIGTSDNGIIVYNLQTHEEHIFNKSNGLHSDFIYNIITDNEGNIWAGTGYGIHKISFVNGAPIFYFYGKGEGVTGMESNHNAVFKMQDGSIWFGTTNGALHYQPKSQVVQAQPVSVVMQSVKLFGEGSIDSSYYDSTDAWYAVPYHLRLPYRKNNITFTFHAISLSGGEQLHYRYRIDGLDAPWSEWSLTTSVTYSALPPGNYVFRVQCTTDNGIIKELKYPFTIITPFHKTNLFRVLILAGCILLGVILQYIANKRKQNRQLLLDKLRREEQNKVRQRTAEDFHDEVGNKLTRINVLTNVLKSKMGDLTPDSKRIIDQIQDNTAQLYSGTRDILWSLKPSNDNLYEILYRIRDFGAELFQDTDVNFTFTGNDEHWREFRLPMDISRNLIMIFKEAMNNCLKYSGATSVSLDINIKQKNVLQLVLKDNGKGFDPDKAKKGHGINNMNVRTGRLHGKLYIDSRENFGTIITLTFKIPQTKGTTAYSN